MKLSRTQRYLVALGLGFVAYRITVEFMAYPPSILLGLVVAGCTWALTRTISKPKPPKNPPMG